MCMQEMFSSSQQLVHLAYLKERQCMSGSILKAKMEMAEFHFFYPWYNPEVLEVQGSTKTGTAIWFGAKCYSCLYSVFWIFCFFDRLFSSLLFPVLSRLSSDHCWNEGCSQQL